METRKRSYITAIERVLNSEQLLERQRKTLVRFDRFNACIIDSSTENWMWLRLISNKFGT